jgi:hypothetical protein
MNYTKIADNVDKQFAKAGRTIIVSRETSDVDIAGKVATTVETCEAVAVVLPLSKWWYDNFVDDGAFARKVGRLLKVAASGMTFEPRAFDKVTFDGATWIVLGCTVISPAGIPLVYNIGVVRS